MYKKCLALILVSVAFGSCALLLTPNEELNKKADYYISQGKVNQAIPLVKKAAKRGDAEAQYNLGYCFEKGVGVEINQDKSIKWYQKSAQQNYMDAEYALMMAYAEGKGVEKNNEIAFEYALRCAEKKDPTCMFNVIGSYQDGRGIEADSTQLLKWAFKLAKLPNPPNQYQSGKITSARLQIAQMYTSGNLVNQNLFEAYKWYLIYNENKYDVAYLQQEQIISKIKTIESSLNNEQIKQAKKEAEELIERPLSNLNQLYKAEEIRRQD